MKGKMSEMQKVVKEKPKPLTSLLKYKIIPLIIDCAGLFLWVHGGIFFFRKASLILSIA